MVDGGAAMSPEVARRVIQLFREIRPPAHADYHLTPHETRLLTLLVDAPGAYAALNPNASRSDHLTKTICTDSLGPSLRQDSPL